MHRGAAGKVRFYAKEIKEEEDLREGCYHEEAVNKRGCTADKNVLLKRNKGLRGLRKAKKGTGSESPFLFLHLRKFFFAAG